MRKHDVISLIYANLEKTSAIEEAARTNTSKATPTPGCRCDRWAHACTADPYQRYKQQLPIPSVLLAK
jgi:hypothetical protein